MISEPTFELRFQQRYMPPNHAIDHTHAVMILQQRWKVTDRGCERTEWRDVPTVTE